jgi:PAS domain S-box-containing protein
MTTRARGELEAQAAAAVAAMRQLVREQGVTPDRAVAAAIDALPVAAFVADDEGHYVAVNEAATVLTGYKAADLRRMSVWELTPEVLESEAPILWKAFLATGEQRGDYRIVTKDGRSLAADYAARANVLPGLHLSLLRAR